MTSEAERSAFLPLPDGPGRYDGAAIFDHLADLYDEVRPGYPADSIAATRERCAIGPESRVLEIGCGTGQATRDVAPIGCSIHCVEPGPHLADLARKNLAAFPRVRVSTERFEDLDEEPGSYDVVFSATAFHWIDPRVSFEAAANLLRARGSLALLTNAHTSGGSQAVVATEIADLHRRLNPETSPWSFPSVEELTSRARIETDIAPLWSMIDRKSGEPPSVAHLFEPPEVSVHPWEQAYDRATFVAMLSTHSTYAVMDPGRREELLGSIGDLVAERLGGVITKEYATVVATARRR